MIADLPRQGSAQKSHQVTLGLRGRRSRLGGRRSGFLGSGGCGGSLVIPAVRGPLIGQTGEGDGLIRLVLVGLNIMLNVTDGIVVYPKVVRSRLMAELPFMASENIMMQAVEKGGNRQELHERLRQHAIAAGKQVKEEGLPNDMVDRVAADPAFGLTKEEIVAGLVPENFVGRAPQQVEEFIANVLQPIFDADPEDVEQHASLSV